MWFCSFDNLGSEGSTKPLWDTCQLPKNNQRQEAKFWGFWYHGVGLNYAGQPWLTCKTIWNPPLDSSQNPENWARTHNLGTTAPALEPAELLPPLLISLFK